MNIIEKKISENKSVYEISPPTGEMQRKLNPMEVLYSTIYLNECLYFNGKMDVKEFLRALTKTLDYFRFLFFQITERQDGLYAEYGSAKSDKNNYFIQLECEETSETIAKENIISGLPSMIDNRILTGVVDRLDGLPMVCFKLRILKDGFSIGYYINHTFIDQSTLVYFFKVLSRIYNEGDKAKIKIPKLVDIFSLVKKSTTTFKDKEEFRVFGKKLGWQYSLDPKIVFSPSANMAHADMYLNNQLIDEIKSKAKKPVSSNDLIHAILIKIYVNNDALADTDTFRLGFACDMRAECGIEEEDIGNIILFYLYDIDVSFARQASIEELAAFNRSHTKRINKDMFSERLNWFEWFQKWGENKKEYFNSAIADIHCLGVSNWVSFNYDEICFNQAKPVALRFLAKPAVIIFPVITFDNESGEKKTVISSNTNHKIRMDDILALETKFNLYKTAVS